jgi:hypothetical protein
MIKYCWDVNIWSRIVEQVYIYIYMVRERERDLPKLLTNSSPASLKLDFNLPNSPVKRITQF